MMEAVADAGWRGSPDLWLDAAYELLLDSGVDAVRILPLAKTLKLSRTSFYWFFKDRDALLDALLARWRDRNTGNVVKQANAYAETIDEALLNVTDCWFDSRLFDSKLEFAIRSWALQSGSVQAEVKTADEIRLTALIGMFQRFGYADLSADVRSRNIYLLQIGYITMQIVEPLSLRLSRTAQYLEIFLGRQPEQRALDRFLARHGYTG
jgi:AcrR family transcriptional regulator